MDVLTSLISASQEQNCLLLEVCTFKASFSLEMYLTEELTSNHLIPLNAAAFTTCSPQRSNNYLQLHQIIRGYTHFPMQHFGNVSPLAQSFFAKRKPVQFTPSLQLQSKNASPSKVSHPIQKSINDRKLLGKVSVLL